MGEPVALAEQTQPQPDHPASCGGADRRQSTRRRWRRRLKAVLTEPGGNRRELDVVARNLSSDGVSLLCNGFLHIGTRCQLTLITADDTLLDVQGTVVRCRYVAGRVHEAGLRFDAPLDDRQFVSHELAATILVVDDAEEMLQLLGYFLGAAGAQIIAARSGEQALSMAADRTLDLVLLDVEMPGMNGPAVAKKLRERGVAIPIIAFTAYDDRSTRERCLSAGCNDVLTKPLSRRELVNSVARYLTSDAPMISRLAGHPEMAEFIRDFVGGLPGRIQEIRRALQARNARELDRLARHLKVAASDSGGCGFGELSAAAGRVVQAVSGETAWPVVEQAVMTLVSLASRVR